MQQGKQRLSAVLRKLPVSSRLATVLVVVILVGTFSIIFSHAATSSTSLEAENGTTSGNACVTSDATASAGSAVKFSSSSCGGSGVAPATPAASGGAMCGSSALNGPTTAPGGSVTVTSMSGISGSGTTGNPYSLANVNLATANTTYYFPAGTYTLGGGQFGQIDPAQGDTYIGAPGAIIDGQKQNAAAFVASYQAPFVTNVTIEYLTIQNFNPPGSQGAVNGNAGSNWTTQFDTITNNSPGSAMMIGSNDTVTHNCLTHNGQYAFNGYLDPSYPAASAVTGGPHDITLSNNEIAFNDTCNWETTSPNPVPNGSEPANCSGAGQFDGCGCAGGGKFWHAQNVTITNNYDHDNYDPGFWPDTNNDGFLFQNNYIANNFGEGIMYETSYNALIKNNTFVGNAVGAGPLNAGFPTGAIYLSESGGDSAAANSFNYSTINITGNVFTDNWDGVVLWENPNRFCGGNIAFGQPDGNCTLVIPGGQNTSPQSCLTALESSSTNQQGHNPNYFDLCRWETKNVLVNNNTFNLTRANVGSACTTNSICGENALFSAYGSVPSGASSWPYGGAVVPNNVTFHQGNLFSSNTYTGPWTFFAWNQGSGDNPVTPAQWMATGDKCASSGEQSSGACNSGFGQDAGSTFH